MPQRSNRFRWGDELIKAGSRATRSLSLGNNPIGAPRDIQVHILNGAHPGPVLAVTGAVHGNELNGIGIIHHLAFGDDHVADTTDDFVDLSTLHGTLLLVPVVNIEGVLLGTRETPDRRDLNRMFPGRPNGNQAQRIAWAVFTEIVHRSDYLIDLHTAAATRMNVPHVRADLEVPACKAMARAFGTEVVMHSAGTAGTLRREAARAGVPTILLETGSANAFEVDSLAGGVHGVLNVMGHLDMIERVPTEPPYRVLVRSSRWLRSDHGGLLHLEVKGGQIVRAGDTVALVTDPLGSKVGAVVSSVTGLIVGLATTPMVRPGDPIAHVVLVKESLDAIEAVIAKQQPTSQVEEEVLPEEGEGPPEYEDSLGG